MLVAGRRESRVQEVQEWDEQCLCVEFNELKTLKEAKQ